MLKKELEAAVRNRKSNDEFSSKEDKSKKRKLLRSDSEHASFAIKKELDRDRTQMSLLRSNPGISPPAESENQRLEREYKFLRDQSAEVISSQVPPSQFQRKLGAKSSSQLLLN